MAELLANIQQVAYRRYPSENDWFDSSAPVVLWYVSSEVAVRPRMYDFFYCSACLLSPIGRGDRFRSYSVRVRISQKALVYGAFYILAC